MATDPARKVSEFKAFISTLAESTKQLKVSKELQRDAEVMVRRSERALGVAIREGQERGEIETLAESKIRGVVVRESARGHVDGPTIDMKPKPRDFATHSELYHSKGGVMDMTDDVTDSEFESAVTAARQEGNVSRANVVRKIKQAKAGPMDEPSENPEEALSRRPTKSGHRRKDIDILKNVEMGLGGYIGALDQIIKTGLDTSVTSEEAGALHADLNRHIKQLNRVAALLKTRKESK